MVAGQLLGHFGRCRCGPCSRQKIRAFPHPSLAFGYSLSTMNRLRDDILLPHEPRITRIPRINSIPSVLTLKSVVKNPTERRGRHSDEKHKKVTNEPGFSLRTTRYCHQNKELQSPRANFRIRSLIGSYPCPSVPIRGSIDIQTTDYADTTGKKVAAQGVTQPTTGKDKKSKDRTRIAHGKLMPITPPWRDPPFPWRLSGENSSPSTDPYTPYASAGCGAFRFCPRPQLWRKSS
jgi:hypothetical protein